LIFCPKLFSSCLDVNVIAVVCIVCSFYDLVMEMIADRSSAVLDVESDVKLCSIKVTTFSHCSAKFFV